MSDKKSWTQTSDVFSGKPNPHIADASKVIDKLVKTVDSQFNVGRPKQEALQALAQGLIAKMPEKWKSEVSGGKAEGYNQALDEVTKIIQEFFK